MQTLIELENKVEDTNQGQSNDSHLFVHVHPPTRREERTSFLFLLENNKDANFQRTKEAGLSHH